MSPSENRRCLMTGASGYVGSSIKARLMADGWEIVELTRHPRPGTQAIRFRLGDPVDPETIAGCTALVHCAYDFNPVSWDDIRSLNVRGSELLLRSAHQAGIKRLVFISTISAFHGCRSLYGQGKLEVEAIAQSLGAWIVRPGLVHSEKAGGMFGRLIEQVKRSSLLPIPGSGAQQMYMVSDADLGEAVSRCLEPDRKVSAVPITVAHEKAWPFRSILHAIGKALGRSVVLLPVPWQLMWIGLRATEALKIPLGLRSDSLVSLVNQDTKPVLNAFEVLGVQCRPFDPHGMAMVSTSIKTG